MLGKLIKHEYIYLLKKFSIIYVVYLSSALLVKLFSLFSVDYSSQNAMYFTLSMAKMCVNMTYGLLTGFLAFLTIIDNLRRFKKNMFSDEGYLTNTLPVTATQHIAAKILSGATNYLVSLVVLFLGMLIVVSSDAIDLLTALVESLREVPAEQLVCLILLLITVYVAFILFGYLVAAMNSMANSKWLVGFGICIAGFFFMITAVSFVFSFIQINHIDSPVAEMLIFSAFFAACAAGMYALIVNIIKKHLNLQ